MQCPRCKHINRDSAKFCEECGEKLQAKCPNCGAELRPNAKFCDECGTKVIETQIRSTIPRLEDMHAQLQSLIPEALAQKYLSAEQMATGENRSVTALFADISGFTPLSATKSPEAIFSMVQDCFKKLVSIVAKYEGSISGFRGDGLLALFGAPILHENDAERAILSAIDMREAMKDYQLQVSIGINTAMMTVGEIQTQLHLDHLTQHERELDRYISEFEDRDLVYQERMIPELEYAFKHALTQESAYQGIVSARRREFHRQVAEGIEQLYGDRLEEFYERLAYHWERCGDKEKAIDYLIKTAKKLERQYANDVAIEFYTRAIDLANEIKMPDKDIASIYELRGTLYNNMEFYEEAIEDYLKVVDLNKDNNKRANMYQAIARTYAWSISDTDEAIKYAYMAIETVDPEDKSRDAALVYDGAATIFIDAIDLAEGERQLRKAISISEEMGYIDLLAEHYTLLDWMYANHRWKLNGPDDIRKRREEARKKALYYLNKSLTGDGTPGAPAGTGGLYLILGNSPINEEKFIFFNEKAFEIGVKNSEGWTVVITASRLGGYYRGKGQVEKAIGIYEEGWKLGVRLRHIFGSYMLNLTKQLMTLYANKGENQKILDMMVQMLESTMILHGKPKVYPIVCRRWNSTVEEIYRFLHSIAPDTYREFEKAIQSRLEETRDIGERFFYYGQLMLLAILDTHREDIKAYAEKLSELKQNAGTFAERISENMKFAIEVMSVSPEQVYPVMKELLNQIERIDDFRDIMNFIAPFVDYKTIKNAINFNKLERTALNHIRNLKGISLAQEWLEIERLYENFGSNEYLTMLAEKAWDEAGDNLRNEGVSQLLKEHYEFGDLEMPEFTEHFNQETLDTSWEWIDPLNNFNYTIEDGRYLQINISSGHDIFPGSNYNAPRLLRKISGDFIIETMMTDGENYTRHGGLLIWKDEQNFIRLETSTYSYWPNTIYCGANINGRFIHPGVHPLTTKSAYLRIERKDDRFTVYVSTDNREWYRCGWVDMFVADPIKVGIYVQCTGSSFSSTRFGYFKIYRPR